MLSKSNLTVVAMSVVAVAILMRIPQARTLLTGA